MKIQFKIILLLVAISLLAVTVLGISLSIQGEKALIQRVREQLESVTVLKESQLNNFIKTGIRDIEEIVGLNPIQNYLSGLYHASTPLLNTEKEEISKLLNQKLNYTEFTEIFIITMGGKTEFSTDSKQIGKIRKEENYFIEGKKGTFVQNFYYDITLRELAITISTPITDKKGDVVGVAAGRARMAGISELMLERSGLGKTGETYLVNKFTFAVSELKKEPGAVLKKAIYTDAVKDCLKGNQAFSKHNDYAGDEVFEFYKWIPERETCLLAKIDQEEALEPVRQFRNTVLLVSAGIVVLVVLLGFLFSKIITKPIIVLRDAALEIRRGKLGTRIEIKTRDEIGQLAASFNEMASHLEEYARGLEEKIKERTRELEKAKASLEVKVQARTQELRELAESLEKKVEERTKELAQRYKQLESQKNELDRTTEMLIRRDINLSEAKEKLAEALVMSDKARKEAEEAKIILEEKVEELEKFHKLSVGRELKMIELKEEIEKLKNKPSHPS